MSLQQNIINFGKNLRWNLPLNKRQIISLVVAVFILGVFPLTIYLALNPQIWKPKAVGGDNVSICEVNGTNCGQVTVARGQRKDVKMLIKDTSWK